MSDLIEDLEQADAAYREADDAVQAIGEQDLKELEKVVDEFKDLLATYVETASGSGREVFQEYVDFQGEIATFEDRLPEDLPERDVFSEAVDYLDQRRLSESDFERARSIISPAVDLTARLDERIEARNRYRDVRHALSDKLRELDRELNDLDRILKFEAIDLDASVEDLREPIETYNTAIREAFTDYKRTAEASSVLALVETTRSFPLASFQPPPDNLTEYLATHEPGEEPIATLLEWTDYTRSKLAHFVDDPGQFQAHVGANRTYLDRLSGDPLTITWPPRPADELRWRVKELIAVVDRFAPPETVESLHAVRALTRQSDFESLRKTAVAEAELTPTEKDQLQTGAIHEKRDRLQDQRDRIAEALDSFPER